VQAVKSPEAAGREKGTVVVPWQEEQPYSTAVFVAADEAEDGGYNGEYCGNERVRRTQDLRQIAFRTYRRHDLGLCRTRGRSKTIRE
jgi:hypothetical protein